MGGVAWTEEEDHLLKKCIEQYGEGKWHRVPLLAGLNRCRKSCRLRWLNYLRPNIKRGNFEKEEVDLIIKLHRLLGNRWSLIAGRLPGRTANDVKNYWNCHLSKRLSAQEANVSEENKQVAKINSTNVEIIRPQPINFATTTTSSMMKIPSSPEGPNEHQQQQQEPPKEDNNMTPLPPPPLLQQVDEDHGKAAGQDVLIKEDIDYSYLGIEEEVHALVADDLGMDFQFEEVKVACNVESSITKWDLDDLILDMDLWNETM